MGAAGIVTALFYQALVMDFIHFKRTNWSRKAKKKKVKPTLFKLKQAEKRPNQNREKDKAPLKICFSLDFSSALL